MLKGNPNVFHYSTFETADKLFAQHPTWQQGRIEVERKLVFEEYVAELKEREVVSKLDFLPRVTVRCLYSMPIFSKTPELREHEARPKLSLSSKR